MKIAIYHNLPSGGGKRALFEMTKRLAENHSLDVHTLSTANHDYCDVRPFSREHKIYSFSPLPLARSPFGRINQIIRIIDIFRRRHLEQEVARQIDAADYDVVFAHNCQFGQSPAILKYLRTPSVYFCAEPPRLLYEPKLHRPYFHLPTSKKLLDQIDPLPEIYRKIMIRVDYDYTRSSSLVLANSAYSRETMYRTYGIFSKVAYLGVDTDRFQSLSLPREPYVISVGSLSPSKGYSFLIESLGKIPNSIRPQLFIVSNYTDLNERSYLDQIALESGVHVEYKSMISDNELVQLYNQALMTVYAPIMEPFGFVPLESMACGTPVVGVQEAGVRESVVHEVTGLLTQRDTKEFATAVECLICDTDYRERLGKKGAEYVREKWQWESSVRFIVSQLAATASTNGRSTPP